MAQLLLGRGLVEPRLAQLGSAHEREPVADPEDQRRGLLDLDLGVGRLGGERRHVLDASIALGRREPRALGFAGVDAQRLEPRAEHAPARIDAARAADIEQGKALAAQPVGDESRERHHTVATGVAGEPTAPGRRSGGAVSRKRERFVSRR